MKQSKSKRAPSRVPLTAERLRKLLHYDPGTGVFTRRVRAGGYAAGSLAGRKNRRGYIEISVDGGRFRAHRLAWLYVHGRWPVVQIDHINGRKADNRLANLRECSNAENHQNQRQAHSHSSSGLLGVSFDKRALRKPWRAQIKANGRARYLGYFATRAEARTAYLAAKKKLHPFYAHSDEEGI